MLQSQPYGTGAIHFSYHFRSLLTCLINLFFTCTPIYCDYIFFICLGNVYRGGCEVLPCRVGPGPGPSTQSRDNLQRP